MPDRGNEHKSNTLDTILVLVSLDCCLTYVSVARYIALSTFGSDRFDSCLHSPLHVRTEG